MYLSLFIVLNIILIATAQKFVLSFNVHPYSEFVFTSLSSCIWTMRLCHGNNYTDRLIFPVTGDAPRSETAIVTRMRTIGGSTPFTFTITASITSSGAASGNPSTGQSVSYGMYQIHTNNNTEFYLTVASVDNRLLLAATGQNGEPLEICNPIIL